MCMHIKTCFYFHYCDHKGRKINFYKLENFGFDLPECQEQKRRETKNRQIQKTKKKRETQKHTPETLKNVKNLMKGKGHKRLPRVLQPLLWDSSIFYEM